MNQTINGSLADGTGSVVYYALKVNGRLISNPVSSRSLLEQQVNSLPVTERASAQIVTVTADSREILLG